MVNFMEFKFEYKSVGCSSCESKISSFDISGNRIIFSGNVWVPNPCYSLKAEIKEEDSVLSIHLVAISSKKLCIQCIGQINFKGEILDISKSINLVRIYYGNEKIFEKKI